MAPRAARSGAREAKPTAAKTRATNRAGITKRKAKIDGDGDMDMDGARRKAGTDGATSKGRPTTRAAQRIKPSKVAQNMAKHLANGQSGDLASRVKGASKGKGALTYLRVHGMKQSKAANNPDGGLKDLLSFMERKSTSLIEGRRTRQVVIKKSHVAGDYVFIGASADDAVELLKVNTFVFAGQKLEVVESNDSLGQPNKATESKETQELRAKLQSVLSQRYIGANKLLKLDSLATDPELVTLGMFDNRDRALRTFKGLMAICEGLFKTAQEKRDAIESVSLASNSIDDITQVEGLATTFADLKNLDLSGNQLASIQGLGRWKGKFKSMEAVYLTGNPIETAEPNLQTILLEWFPKLQNINGIQVRTPEQIAQREEELRPKPIPQSGPDFRDVNGIGENFLLQFFSSYDSDRQSLASRLYDETSQFSLAVDTRSVRDPDAPPPMPWTAYLKFSRNLVKINNQNARIQRLFKGAATINDLWKGLPFTRHPNIKDDISKYIMDCHPLPGLVDPQGNNSMGVDGLIISVHGEFEEHDAKTSTIGKRSFSRTFILGPGLPGHGEIRVVSDMLSLRAYSPLPNVFVAPTPAQAAPSQEQHQAMIAELCKQTGMVAQYSELCLVQVGWDFDKALVIFNEKKAQLPADAFAVQQ